MPDRRDNEDGKEKDRLERQLAEARQREQALKDTRRAVLNLLEDLDEDRRKIAQAEREWRAAFDGVRDAIVLLDAELHIIRANRAYAEMAKLPRQQIVGKPYWQVFPKRERPLPGHLKNKPAEVDFTEAGFIYRSRYYPLQDERGEFFFSLFIMEDITERRRMEQRISYMAQHDPLTGLPNRRFFLQRLEHELAQARRGQTRLGLLFFDLDRFKHINDTLGHQVGDELLKAVAARLRSRLRGSDMVARIGGDEFNILLPDLQRGEHAGEVAGQIVNAFQRGFAIDEQEIYISPSIGISLYPDDGETGNELLCCADLAMYDVKEEGGNNFRFYNPAVNLRSQERMRIENSLRQALERDELRVVYQPKVDLRTDRIVGAEALVRWQHPKLGLLHPERFIEVAEETDLITAIDNWVLRAACIQLRSWLDQGLPPICVSVNFSARQFQKSDLIETIDSLLNETRLPAKYLELELTESVVMTHIEKALPRMRALAATGIHIAVDDFGTGYSSLNYLKRLPIGTLKIDQSFVRDISTDADDRAIVHAVTSLAHTLNKQVVAEGVETAEQLAFLRATECDQAQGFLFHRPLQPGRLAELLPQLSGPPVA